jgi:F-type H+-transporting ATPase subunit b
MEYLLSPDTGMMAWTIIVFLLLVALVGRFSWGPIVRALQEREAGIRKALDDAAQAQRSAQALKEQLDNELRESQTRMQELIKQAKADGQKIREQTIHEAQEEAKRIGDQARQQLEEEKKKMFLELRQQIAGLSVQVAEKILRHSVDAKENDAYVQEALREIDKGAKN